MTYLTEETAKVGMKIFRYPSIIYTITKVYDTEYSNVNDYHKYMDLDSNNNSGACHQMVVIRDYWTIVEEAPTTIVPLLDKECSTCSKMNDAGTYVCWCCGNKP
jgi:hypothetical protein